MSVLDKFLDAIRLNDDFDDDDEFFDDDELKAETPFLQKTGGRFR